MKAFISLGLAAAVALAAGASAQPRAAAKVSLTRLDCGSIRVSDFDVFSATYLYPGKPKALTASCSGGAKVEPVARDKDVFGDKSVVILDMPGHTPGHKVLLVRLASGPVLLSGDLYHATEQVPNRGVPSFNTNRADTLASFDRFQAIARSLKAKVIIQHEAADSGKLPAFPAAAE